MSGSKKRLDLQFGSFACSVQGFKDPVQPVQQVLQALQNLLEETPDLADASISFDADAIERLKGEVARRADIDDERVEIVPGLIIVHRPESAIGNEDADDDEAWSPDEAAGGEEPDEDIVDIVAEEPQDADEEPEPEEAPQYVNIFGAASEATDAEFAGPEDADEPGESFGNRLRRIHADEPEDAESLRLSPSAGPEGQEPARDIFADTGGSSGSGIFADPTGGDQDAPGEAGGEDQGEDEEYTPINFFASAAGHGEAGHGEAGREKADDDKAAAATVSLFAELAAADSGAEEARPRPGLVEHLFGEPEEEAGASEAEEGRTAASIAKAAGAETVPELIVSAAAWMVLLQGQTTFTRRDVIKVFETIPGDHPDTLEARIKGFGKAVRNGQLIMVEDGVFGLSRTELERFQSLL